MDCIECTTEDPQVKAIRESEQINPQKVEQFPDDCQCQPPHYGTPCQPGRRVYVTHPNIDPNSRPDCYTMGQKGYGRPHQHPLFITTNSDYGRIPPPIGLNKRNHPRDCSFTMTLTKFGNYQDDHLTTELHKEYEYRGPSNDILRKV